MNESFQNGDVVCLKSGSMPMTVVNTNKETGEILVAYFDLDANVMRDGFPPEALEFTHDSWKMKYCVDLHDDEEEEEDGF
jgi:uncharacterized protein YodC (DUF2158 family)